MDEFKQQCKLCDNIITDGNFEIIDATKSVFDILLLNLTLDNETQNVMCTVCFSKLLAALKFKSTCLDRNKSITPYIDFENPKPVDLKEVYAKEKGCKQGGSVLDDVEVCRLCLNPTSGDHKSIQEMPVDNIQICIPEINFAVTTNPVICTKCYDALCIHSGFIKNCLEVEKKINMAQMDVEGIHLINPFIKTEEIEIKSELVDDETLSEILCNIKKEEEEERDTSLHSQNGLVDIKDTESLYELEDLKPASADSTFANHEKQLITETTSGLLGRRVFECDICDYKTFHKHDLKAHGLRHKDLSEMPVYMCDKCDYRTKIKRNLKRHQLKHRDRLDVKMYACGECQFESKRKGSLKRHQWVHKIPSEVRQYKCDMCDYKSAHKHVYNRHVLTHKDPAEVRKYMCDECDYKSCRKTDFEIHKLKHKYPSEVQMYRCDECDFSTRYRKGLRRHRILHKNRSELQTYECEECDYKTIHKPHLFRHQLKHQDPSQVRKFECGECDYRSTEKGNLKAHQLTHRAPFEVQMFKCDRCEYETKLKRYLAKHVLRHKLDTDRK